ncbi:hypothetical protein BC628DRAFT_1411271 [Trametes gibbosa]|nr:hypothetical protein BC628DRAFT_1411271 [Trametes gibbosa]
MNKYSSPVVMLSAGRKCEPNITDEQFKTCATLFSDNYGIWATNAPSPFRAYNKPAPNSESCLSAPGDSLTLTCSLEGDLVGHACVTKWRYQEGEGYLLQYIGWVTQLVVDSRHRRQHIATDMLRMLKQHRSWFDHVNMIGIASSHPPACNSLCNLFDGDTRDVDLGCISQHAAAALLASPIPYLREAPPQGALAGVPGGSYSANTSFFVDHAAPLEILKTYVENGKWAFWGLLDGHEFLVLIPVPGRSS